MKVRSAVVMDRRGLEAASLRAEGRAVDLSREAIIAVCSGGSDRSSKVYKWCFSFEKRMNPNQTVW